MKNISSIQKYNKTESPKTPGGISKSLLTPCRRLGLSRKWRKSGPSPFISPLSGTERSAEPKQEKSKKRKCPSEDDSSQEISQNSDVLHEEFNETTSCNTSHTTDTNLTPTRNLLPRKKSKTLLLTKVCEEEHEHIPCTLETDSKVRNNSKIEAVKDSPENVSKLSRKISKNKSKIQKSPLKVVTEVELSNCEDNSKGIKHNIEKKNSGSTQVDSKKSPENLTKECMIVIQKKILKSNDNKTDSVKLKIKSNNPISQELFDSDSDDIPLSNINKKENQKTLPNDDDEFQNNKKTVKKLQHKTTSTSELKPNSKAKQKVKPIDKTIVVKTVANIHSSQESCDIDDDDFVPDKKTILIKKTYDKVTKPSKAKSTGSITQKDIDELKKRIEVKKNLLLAKAMTNETEELRSLIKKWQKGCQNALAELLELMKTKMPDKQNMDFAEILKLLKIPKDLVGYDSENDCFNTPDDTNIVLSGLSFE